ncbi:AAA family ATPase [Shewanella schlegeliana]|uniref:AAA family ATPase n=1 Tax=Shewanella schlegeliana TaxID=190308 RepID=A0ABS1T2Y8_9GAMM|nr:AAA family ATPase [Shewanella schlegeliana]MBL4915054.1 AAA family ATPase [Shewanella schlegeliana]MCL1110534.1 AAA family ATPase [Shewanella schlegeliana]GIU32424.1 ATPase AAA [Shewanella schlegeliana]
MPFSDSTLLPSQHSLLHRLLHISLYGEQLMVLTGEEGAGKTTLVTALLNELERHSSAFVICPKHCDSAEIRRKVLVQLLSDPVFDDEIPLPESLLSVAESLPTASCIVLDDAHLLPLEIWAECIVLSQMNLGNKSVKIVMTSPIEFFDDVAAQLPESLLEQVLPIHIEPLEQAEREGLYYTLLSRSEQQPFTPRDIVKNRLELQRGTPKEVVSLLELALNGDEQQEPANSRIRTIVSVSFLCIAVLLLSWLLLDGDADKKDPASSDVKFAIDAKATPDSESRFLAEYGEQLLANYLRPLDAQVIQSTKPQAEQVKEEEVVVNDIEAVATYKAKPITTFSAETEKQAAQAPQSQGDKKEVVAAEAIEPKASQTSSLSRPTQGYTLQLASVKQIDSLYKMLAALKDIPEVRVARYKQRWVVLFGEFNSAQVARQQAVQLTTKTGISAPWIRTWQDLNEYELQDVLPSREIQ